MSGVAGDANSFTPFEWGQREQSIPSRFEAQVLQYPDRPAIKADGTVLTYRSLNEAANRIAWAILDRVGAVQKPVVYLLADDVKSLATMLGILKSGNINVPSDLEHPQSRITRILEDAEPVLIVTDQHHLAMVKELAVGTAILDIDALSSGTTTDNPGLPIGPDSLANIIYTSGSTGQPKGVLQTHRFRLFRTMNVTNSLRICAADRTALLSARTSGQAMTNIFSAILNGAAICPFRTREVGLEHLAIWLIQEEITIY